MVDELVQSGFVKSGGLPYYYYIKMCEMTKMKGLNSAGPQKVRDPQTPPPLILQPTHAG